MPQSSEVRTVIPGLLLAAPLAHVARSGSGMGVGAKLELGCELGDLGAGDGAKLILGEGVGAHVALVF